MGARDANKVQLDFPQLTADVIAALRLTGTLGLFELSDTVVPTISVGNVRPQTFAFNPVVFDSSEIVSGNALSPVANQIIFDTGSLSAGIYDCFYGMSSGNVTTRSNIDLEWRNAANTANLATFPYGAFSGAGTQGEMATFGPFSLNIGLNERLRLNNVTANGGIVAGYLMIALRPVP